MFSKDDILARLRKGDTADLIASEMADQINAAINEYNEEKAAKAASRAKARAAVDALMDYFAEAMGEPVPEEKEREQLTDVLEACAKPKVSDDDILHAFLNALS